MLERPYGVRSNQSLLLFSQLREAVVNNQEIYAEIISLDEISPSVITRIVLMHMAYYGKYFGFGETFERSITKDLRSFAQSLPEQKSKLWLVTKGELVLGSLAIDGVCLGAGLAQLRWFILDPSLQSKGLGHALILKAIDFCRLQKFREIQLWTFSDLQAARALYRRHDFRCVEEAAGAQWGVEVIEQRYLLQLES